MPAKTGTDRDRSVDYKPRSASPAPPAPPMDQAPPDSRAVGEARPPKRRKRGLLILTIGIIAVPILIWLFLL